MYFLNFASFTNGQPQSTLNGHANRYKLWFISSLRNLRAETSCIPQKTETSCIPTKNVYVSLRQIRHYLWNLLFISTKNLRSRLQSVWTSRKTDFRKLKITLVTMTYHSQRLQCPSLSPHVLLARFNLFGALLFFQQTSNNVESCYQIIFISRWEDRKSQQKRKSQKLFQELPTPRKKSPGLFRPSP